MEPSDALRDAPNAEDKSTEVEAPAAIAPTIDLDDDQRGPKDLFDIENTSGATTGSGILKEYVITYKTVFKYQGVQFSKDLQPTDG